MCGKNHIRRAGSLHPENPLGYPLTKSFTIFSHLRTQDDHVLRRALGFDVDGQNLLLLCVKEAGWSYLGNGIRV